jgi:hypothetical protein
MSSSLSALPQRRDWGRHSIDQEPVVASRPASISAMTGLANSLDWMQGVDALDSERGADPPNVENVEKRCLTRWQLS